MASQASSLLQEISDMDNECGQILKDAEIVKDEDLKSLCYESLKEILPGMGKKLVQRSKVWRIIEKSLKGDEKDACSPSISTGSIDDGSDNFSFSESDISEVSTPKVPKHAGSVKLKHPEYSIYVDPEIRAAAESGKMSSELKCRLVRATIHNMTSTAAATPFSRYPLATELQEMAKSLIMVYPCLKDPDTGHEDLFKKLKRKLSNNKPTKKPQGPCPAKKRRKETPAKTSLEDNAFSQQEQPTCSGLEKKGDCNPESDNSGNDDDNEAVLDRHFNHLEKEMKKKTPNREVVNEYLNKEYKRRRDWLKGVPAEERCGEVLKKYPCFTDHREIIEEVRRVLELKPTTRYEFVDKCVGRLNNEVDFLMFYGISTKGVSPPRSAKQSSKIIHVLQKLSVILPRPKALKKSIALVHQLQDHEDPDMFCSKQSGNLPILIFDEEMIYVVVGKKLLFQTQFDNASEAVVAFLGTFYLLDFDYPAQYEYGLLMLQTLVFKDQRVPNDISSNFKAMAKAFMKYKAE